jgi:alcohol dehydrogenase, propanol-preferring
LKAMLLHRTALAESRPLEMSEAPDAEVGAGQILIEVEACGVCRTDLHIIEGEVKAALPIVPGHQAVGRVIALGPGVTEFHTGDVVGVGWLASTCGICTFCTSGRENLCTDATFTGRDVNGGYGERMSADARYVFPIPAGLSALAAAPLLCAGIIGYRSLRLSEIKPGGRLGLIGFGASAHLAIQVARHWGCEVYAFTREEHHRRLAIELGAAWAGEATDDPGVALDAAVTFAPAGELVPQALARIGRGGTLAINAIHMSPIPSFSYDLIYHERSVRSVANFTRRDAVEFLALAAQIPIRADVEEYALAEANDVLLRIKRGEVHGAAVLRIA